MTTSASARSRTTNYEGQSEAPITHLQPGEAMLKIDSAAAHVRLACEIMDGSSGEPLSVQERVKARARTSATRRAWRARRSTSCSQRAAHHRSRIQFKVPMQRYQAGHPGAVEPCSDGAADEHRALRPRAVRARAQYTALLAGRFVSVSTRRERRISWESR